MNLRRGSAAVATRAIAAAIACGLLAGCGGAGHEAQAPAKEAPLVTSPLTALAPAASLVWLLDVRPRALLGDAALAPAVAELIPDATFASLSRLYGVDIRTAEELTIAAYPEAELLLIRAFLDPAKLEAAFAARTVEVEGRGIDREGSPVARVVRTWGTRVGGERVQLAMFGRQAAGLEVGRFGPLRASEGFAEGKLHRASPALAAPPLAQVAHVVDDAPIRFFAPGPFDDATGRGLDGLGGLLGGATAAAVTLTPRGAPGERSTLELTVVLAGLWDRPAEGRPAPDAVFLRQFQALANSAPGRLIGADRTLEPPRVKMSRETLVLTARYDAETLARRLHLALDGPLTALLSSRRERTD